MSETTLAPTDAEAPLTSALSETPDAAALHRLIFLGIAAALVVAPFALYPVFLMKGLCYALLALAFNLLLGYGGLLSFGHAAYFGMASYVCAYAARSGACRPNSRSSRAAAAGVLGPRVRRARHPPPGHLFRHDHARPGADGVFLLPPGAVHRRRGRHPGVPRGTLFGLLDVSSDRALYALVAVIFMAGLLLIYRIIHSPFGQVLKAIRDNEPRAVSLGYRVNQYKLAVFVLSTTLAGVAGATKALVFQLASLTDVHWAMSGEVVLMTLVGGMGTVFGPIAGAFVIVAMENYLAQFGSWVTIIQGAVFVFCVLAFREGLVGLLAKLLRRPL